ncbi:thioredoxin TrxC [Lacimicrobium sp. SS2-24]|uniref:thioredoxin TrxC n=1 Tax=Lacimicrobium sp. SS2-24 TaxID=2005569 RepID=UPI000B4B26CA|nr:thioredoxin TrxC [Lacimicrobium sp. SS2-24]
MVSQNPVHVICASCHKQNRIPASKLAQQPLCGHCRQLLVSGKPVNLNDNQFQRWLDKSDLPLLVDFWAPWCGPCLQFAPVFEQTALTMATRCQFVKVDTQANQLTASRCQIRSIPTLVLFYRAQEVARVSGALPGSQLSHWLAQQLSGLRA